MKELRQLRVFLGWLGGLLLFLAVVISFLSLNTPALLLLPPQAANACTEVLMEAVAQADLSAAGKVLYGTPDLDAEKEFSREFDRILWEALRSSYSYAFAGNCYATDSGLARDVTITALDIPALMAVLKDRAQPMLESKVAETANKDTVYEENGSYRESFVMDVLCQETVHLLETEEFRISKTISLPLVTRDGQWWVVPDQALLSILAGDFT